ncbi:MULTISPECIES: nickel pincer cofactor biosynthesis protein LarB [unclassified Eubacterium (in: firmicutes)]|uniref:nickel pincer cofactor biosynthesis protein LarB n=1 Tax=unclassified Eubacterium (in: firmicutes) TaxID=2624479 RepID=UPI000E4E00B6|nr:MULTISPECIES: nickel pincer cofactor biosynthesis protein LarB [unclassified Eubacterium (in: firmicutes)]RGF51135.1 nickel pincer cofactor biosynthesis protein LarB [Eubacterium sp. AF36-5BH]RHP21868.1 nickel pincer cofactor biosynthesis protein LarB [Eubacterium sp. AF34-35BH]
MDTKELLQLVAEKKVSVGDALLELKKEPFEDLGFAKPDFHRKLRQGVGEVIYGAGKTPDQIAKISESFIKNNQSNILITRMSKEASDYVEKYLEALEVTYFYDEISKVGIVGNLVEKDGLGKIVVATGGTSDMPVAEEAALTAEFLGNHVERLYDVGVAGLHRLLENVDKIMEAKVIIAIAGMEGALASVIGGLADCPVIAVPTSVGYGAAFGGITPLLSMLNSCASGVSVVNIDNGFGAGYMASMINHITK